MHTFNLLFVLGATPWFCAQVVLRLVLGTLYAVPEDVIIHTTIRSVRICQTRTLSPVLCLPTPGI